MQTIPSIIWANTMLASENTKFIFRRKFYWSGLIFWEVHCNYHDRRFYKKLFNTNITLFLFFKTFIY